MLKNTNIQLVQAGDLPDPKDFISGRDEYIESPSVVLYETSWISQEDNQVVAYIGTHQVLNIHDLYIGSGLIVRRAIKKYGRQNIRFKILKSLFQEEIEDRFTIENNYIQAYINKYGQRCRNLRLNGRKGGSIWTPEMKSKFKQTSLEKFGVDHPRKSEVVKAHIRATMQEKLGVDYAMESETVREKSKQTLQEKYKVDNISQVEEIKEKKRQSTLASTGVTAGFNGLKTLETLQKRYGEGVTNPSQIPEVQQKKKENIIKRYTDPNSKTKQTRPVEQIDLSTGKVIATFPSAKAAAYLLFPNKVSVIQTGICSVCKGKYRQCEGFGWRYAS